MVVGLALLVGGVLLILFEKMHKEKDVKVHDLKDITYVQAVIIGTAQALAVVPGVSRSAATIVGGLMLGVSRVCIVEFSFLLAVPTMLAATVLDIIKSRAEITLADWGALAVGFVVAFIVAYAAVRFLLNYVRNNNFIAFGVYRIMMGFLVLLFLARH